MRKRTLYQVLSSECGVLTVTTASRNLSPPGKLSERKKIANKRRAELPHLNEGEQQHRPRWRVEPDYAVENLHYRVDLGHRGDPFRATPSHRIAPHFVPASH